MQKKGVQQKGVQQKGRPNMKHQQPQQQQHLRSFVRSFLLCAALRPGRRTTPYYVGGDNTATGDAYRNTQPLPVGTYWLDSTLDGATERITFSQTC
jgi:hypothetical protein